GLGAGPGVIAEPVLQIAADRQAKGGGHGANVRQHIVTAGFVIRDADRAGVTRAGRGERLEAETRQDASRAGIPRIGRDEGARCGMESGELGGLLGLGLHGPDVTGAEVKWKTVPSGSSNPRFGPNFRSGTPAARSAASAASGSATRSAT